MNNFHGIELAAGTAAFLARPRRMLIGAEWQEAASGETLPVIDPASGEAFCRVPAGDAADIDRAVAAARHAFEAGEWSRMRPVDRERLLLRLADLVEAHAQELAELEAIDNGKPVTMARHVDVALSVDFLRYMAGWATKIEGSTMDVSVPLVREREFFGFTRREPVGVVGAIIPWNFPLLMAAWKLGPALAAGNSVVLKPSEKSPLTAMRLAELAVEAGLPPGVVNVVPGYGHEAGEALALHMDVDAIGFTGSTRVGRKMLEYAGRSNLKRVYNELGGKSAFVVFDDFAHVERAAKTVAGSMFFNQGESCNAPSRVLVHEKVADRFLEVVAAEAPKYAPGDPLSGHAEMGALVDETQMKTVLGYIEAGNSEGAKLVTGGQRARAESGGFYVQPTVFERVRNDMRIAREEIFGPVMSVIRFANEAEAIALANDSSYGLQASVWSDNVNRAHRVARALRAGTVHVNQYDEDDITVPFGGYKQSGNGRDKSLHAFDKYTELKTTWLRIDAA